MEKITMPYLDRIAVLVVLGFFAPHLLAQTTVAGSTPGSFRVTETGSAEYRIPIRVSPGIAGMEPKLALTYNSHAGNGLFGVGWNLEGLSAITRCPKTVAQDGVRGGVKYDSNDRYCLDGQRLMAISGTYGAAATEYRTERESFSKVVSYGTAGNGPAWFKVWTKSGQILEYGNTADSRIEAQGKTTARAWAINKISDTKGNYLTVSYAEDAADGDYRPASIAYTGNAAAGTSPSNKVEFDYQARSDIAPFYLAGSVAKTMKRLVNVKTFAGGATSPVTDYRLAYDASGPGGASRMLSITECGAGGDCYAPNVFTYPSAAVAFQSIAYNAPATSGYRGNDWVFQLADVNGDGKADVVGLFHNLTATPGIGIRIAVMLSNGDGTYAPIVYNAPYTCCYQGPSWEFTVADMNGDGKADVIGMFHDVNSLTPSGIHLAVMHSRGDGTYDPIVYSVAASSGYGNYGSNQAWKLRLGDVNGDGRTDVLALFNDENNSTPNGIRIAVMLSKGDGTFDPIVNNTPATSGYGNLASNQAWKLHVADINGDGKADVAALFNDENNSTPNGIRIAVMLSRGDGTFDPIVDNTPATAGYGNVGNVRNWKLVLGDVNGDGRTDVLALFNDENDSTPNGIRIAVMLSKGDGTFAPIVYNTPATSGYGNAGNVPAWKLRVADLNGDGKADVVALFNDEASTPDSGIRVAAMISRGGGTFQPIVDFVPATSGYGNLAGDPAWKLVLGDVNGDGRDDVVALFHDIVVTPGSGIRIAPVLSQGGAQAMSGANVAAGESIGIVYKPLTDSTVYSKGTGAVYPLRELQAPLYAVASVSRSNGIGGSSQTSHFYTSARLSLDGRGFLGFGTTRATDQQTGSYVLRTFSQVWPYVGMNAQVGKFKSGGGVLSQMGNTLACTNPASGAACAVVAGNRYFPFVSQTVESGNDLNGAALPTVTTTYSSYDLYGNVGAVTVSTGDGYSKTTSNTFTNDTTNWFLGRLTRSTVQSTTP